MPFQNVMPNFGKGKLHSDSKNGPVVKKKNQALAIMMSEKKNNVGPSEEMKKKIMKGKK